MKVLYYIQNLSHKEGSWLSLSALIKYMIGQNVSVIIVAPYEIQKDLVFVEFCSCNEIPVYYVNICFPKWSFCTTSIRGKFKLWYLSIRKIPYKLRCAYELYKIVKKESPRLIHTNVGVLREGFWVSKFMRIPHIWHLREYQDLDFLWNIYPNKRIYERLLKKSDAIITITESIKSHFDLNDLRNAYTIYNGISVDFVKNILLPKEKFFLIASRISPEKGIEDIIRLFLVFCKVHTDYQLIIVGDVSGHYAKKLISDSVKECNIQFIGWKEQLEIENLMKRATALIVNSRYEGLGRMTVEAILRGCIVVGRDIAGTQEIKEKVGGVFAYKNEMEFLSCLDFICKMSEESYRKQRVQAQFCAQKMFSVENSGEKILKIYKSLCTS